MLKEHISSHKQENDWPWIPKEKDTLEKDNDRKITVLKNTGLFCKGKVTKDFLYYVASDRNVTYMQYS